MKPIGLLGGTAWPSTIEYYRQLNEIAAQKFGPGHSAEIYLRSIDYHRLKQYYPNRWDDVARELFLVLKELDQAQPSCIVICNNVLHKAFDLISDRATLHAPVVHIVDSAIELLRQQAIKKPLLLATKFTMEDSFYTSRLSAEGFEVTVPSPAERESIHGAQTQLSGGALPSSFAPLFELLCQKYENCDGILLACTELPAVFRGLTMDRQVIDPAGQQLKIAFEYATGER